MLKNDLIVPTQTFISEIYKRNSVKNSKEPPNISLVLYAPDYCDIIQKSRKYSAMKDKAFHINISSKHKNDFHSEYKITIFNY